MSPVYIKTWVGKHGKRYRVYWRPGGRAFKERYAGSFKTLKEARARRDFVAGELANGRDPQVALDRLKTPPAPQPGLATVWPIWMQSRKDVGAAAKALYGNSRDRWLPILGPTTDPENVTTDGVIAGIDEMLEDLASSTVRLYLSHLAMVLDFADAVPNPARSRKIKLPTQTITERDIPSTEEWRRILAQVASRSRPTLRVMECCALRVSEACGLQAGDLDRDGEQILVRRSITKTKAGRRWIPCPEELLDALTPGRVSAGQVYYDLQRACEKAGTAEYGTHVLRHRRISLWFRHGFDQVQIARWAGHAKASESSDTYGHVVIDALDDDWLTFWLSRSPGAAPVRHREAAE